jgi:hypothetical protein
MGNPDLNLVGVIVDLLSNEWDTANVSQPGVIRARRDEKSVPPGTDEYILVADTAEYLPTWRGGMNTRDHEGAVFAEAKTTESDARRREILSEVDRIMVAHANRRDALDNSGRDLGNWDRLDYNATIRDEEIFDVFPIEFTFTLSAYSRTPG